MTPSQKLIDAAAKALYDATVFAYAKKNGFSWKSWDELPEREKHTYRSRVTIPVTVALEEAAKVVGAMPRTHTKIKEDHDVLGMTGTWTFTLNNGPAECAAAIRAMIKESE